MNIKENYNLDLRLENLGILIEFEPNVPHDLDMITNNDLDLLDVTVVSGEIFDINGNVLGQIDIFLNQIDDNGSQFKGEITFADNKLSNTIIESYNIDTMFSKIKNEVCQIIEPEDKQKKHNISNIGE